MNVGPDYLQAALSLAFVLGLLLVAAAALRRWRGRLPGSSGGRLSVIETRALDARNRLVLVRWDDREHLLLIGQSGSRHLSSRAMSLAALPTVAGPQ